MKSTIKIGSKVFNADLSIPLNIGMPLRRNANANAFHLSDPEFKVVEAGEFVGNVKAGGSCNVENLHLSPHGNGTHTECVGHISKESYFIKDCLNHFHFAARVISLPLQNKPFIDKPMLQEALMNQDPAVAALVVRTLPNKEAKQTWKYSGTNPTYFTRDAINFIIEQGFEHLLTDLPSLDHEDDPNLPAHHAFFHYPESPAMNRTVTELIYVSNEIPDGLYLLNLQMLALESDASPSHPVLYELATD